MKYFLKIFIEVAQLHESRDWFFFGSSISISRRRAPAMAGKPRLSSPQRQERS